MKGREIFITQHGYTTGREKVSISAHLWGTDMSFRFRGRIGAWSKRYV
jgi:hypothetical protein